MPLVAGDGSSMTTLIPMGASIGGCRGLKWPLPMAACRCRSKRAIMSRWGGVSGRPVTRSCHAAKP